MISASKMLARFLALFLLAIAIAHPQAKSAQDSHVAKLRVEVTAGEKSEPVENASVYIRFTEKRFLRKGKKVEMNLKTNHEGVAIMRDLPRGNAMIQVIAPGWKPFGQYFVLDKDEQTIQIKLEKPPRWY